jgi:hypothetical protein
MTTEDWREIGRLQDEISVSWMKIWSLIDEANMKEFFLKLWKERDHVSFVSGQPLGEEPMAYFFSHVIPKSICGQAGRMDPDNIVFMTLEEHSRWENFQSKIENDPMWQPVFELQEKLKEKYNKKI